MRCTWWVALVLGGLSLAPARARGGEWRVSLGLGASATRGSDVHIMQPNSDFTIERMRWRGRSLEIPPYYEIRFEHYPSRRARVGYFFGLVHMKVYGQTQDRRHIQGTIDGTPVDEEVPVSTYVQMFDISHGVNFIEMGVMLRQNLQPSERFPDGRVQPYVGLSLGPTVDHPENKIGGIGYSGQYRHGGELAGMALAGVHYGVTRRWGLYAETKLTHVRDRVSIENGQARTTLNSLHAVLGLSYSF